MTSFVNFTPISGSFNDDPLCYLLEIDQTKILLDCGSDESFTNLESLLVKIKRLTKNIDLILLSHATVSHVGALPFIYKHMALSCPIYATIPVLNFSPLLIIDLLRARMNDGPFDLFGIADVKSCFSHCSGLRFLQNMPLGSILTIPYAAGHSLGGAIWRIRKDTDDIVYAVDYNHKRERHLNGTSLDSLVRPTLLITDTRNALTPQTTRKHRDSEIIDNVLSTLRKDGDVLIPSDSNARTLELLYLLESHWKEKSLASYPIVFLCTYSQRILEYSKSTIEWMSDSVKSVFDSTRENPFEFKFIRLCQKLDQVKMINGPKVVVTTSAGLNAGFSRDLFMEWSSNPNNMIILTSKNPENTLSRKLSDRIDDPKFNQVPIHFQRREPLQGEELRKHLKEEKDKQDREAAEAALAKYRENEDSDEESDMGDDEEGEKERKNVLLIQQELYWTMSQFDLYVKDVYLASNGGLLRSTGFKNAHDNRMFPFFDRKPKFDEYGEAINVEDYIRPEDLEMEAQNKRLEELNKEKDIETDEWELQLFGGDSKVPSKWVSYTLNLQLACQRKFIDFEGLCDSKSIMNILGKTSPRKIIFVHGGTEPTQFLYRRCKGSNYLTNEVFIPQIMENVNVSASSNIYQVKLTDALLSTLHSERVGDYELSYVSGHVKMPENGDVAEEGSSKMDVDEQQQGDQGSSEDHSIVPEVSAAVTRNETKNVKFLDVAQDDQGLMMVAGTALNSISHLRSPVFVGDVKLSEFRNLCHKAGLQTDFYAGDLVLNQCVIVKKAAMGELSLEGSLSPTYYKVRELLYGKHAIL